MEALQKAAQRTLQQNSPSPNLMCTLFIQLICQRREEMRLVPNRVSWQRAHSKECNAS